MFSLDVKQGASPTTMRKQNATAPQHFFPKKYCLPFHFNLNLFTFKRGCWMKACNIWFLILPLKMSISDLAPPLHPAWEVISHLLLLFLGLQLVLRCQESHIMLGWLNPVTVYPWEWYITKQIVTRLWLYGRKATNWVSQRRIHIFS